jgi:hypothetical protein
MTKKKDDHEDKREDEDLDEDETEEDEDEDDEEEDEESDEEEGAAQAKPVRRRLESPVEPVEEPEEPTDEEDPYWWTPHLALSTLVIVGVLGFFGVFNKLLGNVIPKPPGFVAPTLEEQEPAHQATHEPQKEAPKPAARPGMDGAEQAQMYGAKHLLVQYKGSMRAGATITRSKDEAKLRAEEAAKKAKAGAKFDDIVTEYSDEPGAAQRHGDLGTFRKGQMVPQFQDAVEKMKVGEISGLVETPFGYHVIIRTK